MKTLAEVERARAIMREAEGWSVLRWLSEKKKVRRAADTANSALRSQHEELRAAWPPELLRAYDALKSKSTVNEIGKDIVRLAKTLHAADVEADLAHERAEATFAEAEKRMSTAMARQGCAEALHSWDLLEKANAKAAAAVAK